MNKWIFYVGEPQRVFKSQLTCDYIRKLKPILEYPTVKYNFIDKETWVEFVESRSSTKFLVSSNFIF